MTGLTSVLLSGLSGLRASQNAMGVISQNIANASTPGYVRTEVTLSPRTQLGIGGGVEITSVHRAADRFLATASYITQASLGSSSVRADLLARAQSSFGDPAGDTSMFARLDGFWSALTDISVDPSSALRRGDAVSALQSTFSEIQRIGSSIQDLIGEADQRIADAVADAQSLMDRIAGLNEEIHLTKRTGADASAAENAQSALIDELSQLIDVRVTPQAEGGVHVRTSGGALLVGVNPGKISYSPSSAPFSTHGVISLNENLGTQSNLEPFLTGGAIKGLLDVRDKDLVSLAEALGGFSAVLGDTLNAVHNENASYPAVSQMTGRQTGLLGGDSLNFTGEATIGVVNVGGTLTQRLHIDFDAGTITGEAPAATYNFAAGTITSFVSALNTALGASTPAGSATFVNGVMRINASNSGGVVVQQSDTDPADRAGRGFSHFFGLNDLVSRPTPMFFESGLQGSDAHGLNSGGEITYQIRDSMGRYITDRTVTISGGLVGGDMDDLLASLNASGTGLGDYGAFSINATTGQVEFASNPSFQVSLMYDSTQRGATGVSFSAMNGLSQAATSGRAIEVDVNSQIASDPGRLAVGRPDLTVALGSRVMEAGDNRGSAALVAARDSTRTFAKAGLLTSQTTTLGVYAARLGGEAGRLANDSKRAADGAAAVASAAADRRAQVEGVSLDDELLKMTSFQNAYAAAARVIQAATEMLDVLMAIGYR
jgi:flagellar hook-associated protein 1 FlgK